MSCNYIRPVIVPIGPSIAYVELTQGLHALIDSEDAERIGKHNWYARRLRDSFYACRALGRDEGSTEGHRKFVKMHREILGLAAGDDDGDHRDGKTLDNRKVKLREATHLQNSYNRKINCNNSTGFKGVSVFRTPYKIRYRAAIGIDGKLVQLGVRDDPAEAAQLYIEAAKIHHGEYRRV